MHILELPSFFPPHGGLFCLEQAKALKAFGHEVRIVSVVELGVTLDRKFYFTAPWHEEEREMEGVEVFCSYMRAVPKAVRHNTSHWISLCREAVDRYVRRYGKPDVLQRIVARARAWQRRKSLSVSAYLISLQSTYLPGFTSGTSVTDGRGMAG